MVARMGRFDHGADVYSAHGERLDLLDFSSNLNPLGMPDEVRRALQAAAAEFDIYPDPACRALREKLACALGVPAEHIVCTAGASDLIQRLCLAVRPARALVTAPGFSGYEQALELVGARIVRHRLREQDGFAITERLLDADDGFAASSPELVFLCSPNNPTGLVLDRGLLVRVLEAARETGAIVALDECFLEFTGEPSAMELCARYPNLVVMRAFTKTYAVAGVRLGYGVCADERLLGRLQSAGQPWPVSTPAQVAGIAALDVAGWRQRSAAYVAHEREVLADGLRALGMAVIPGQANYLLFQSGIALYEPLLERGILIRRCENYEGLDESWYRVAVRCAADNARLLQALSDIVAKRQRRACGCSDKEGA